MISRYSLQSAIAEDIRRYVALKQALGHSFEKASSILLHLDRFLFGLKTELTPETFQKWCLALEHFSSNTRLSWMRVVWNFCLYRKRMSPECFVPDPGLFPKARPVVRPHIFSEKEVGLLLGHCDAQLENPARSPLRWAGTKLAIILLYTTGVRRGELFRLTPQDYDPNTHTLLIKASKFHKSRLLPLPGDVAGEVDRFLQARCAAHPSASTTAPLLWSQWSRDQAYTGTRLAMNLRILLDSAGIKKADGGRPRVHDFRHSCAVNALIRWYRAGVDVQAKLPLLATWLGHVSILSTYYYLHFVEELRSAANNRFADSYADLIVPAPPKGVKR
jgi:integrase/recombinase XerD